MKDALGHGSESRGAADALAGGHPKSASVPVHPAFSPGRYLIQKLNTKLVGNPWQVAGRVGFSKLSHRPAAKAERIAERMRIDNPNTLIRVK